MWKGAEPVTGTTESALSTARLPKSRTGRQCLSALPSGPVAVALVQEPGCESLPRSRGPVPGQSRSSATTSGCRWPFVVTKLLPGAGVAPSYAVQRPPASSTRICTGA